MKNLFEKYEIFKGGLKWKKLTPKEYEKAVKKWMDQNEKRKKVKNRKTRNGATAPFFFIKKL